MNCFSASYRLFTCSRSAGSVLGNRCLFTSAQLGTQESSNAGASADERRTPIDFSNARESLKSKSTGELMKSYLIYTMFKYDAIVNNSLKIMSLARSILGPSLFNRVMKATVYGQFVAGETDEDIVAVFAKFRKVGIRPVLNYSVEEDASIDEKSRNQRTIVTPYDRTARVLLDSIKLTSDHSEDNDGMIAIKLTGLCPTPLLSLFSKCVVGGERVFNILTGKPSLLEGTITEDSFVKGMTEVVGLSASMSSELWQELNPQRENCLKLVDWKRLFLPNTSIYKAISATNKCSNWLPVLTDKELAELDKALVRIDSLGQCSLEKNVKLLIDAEQTFYQPAIRYMAVNHLMSKYNLDRAVVYNTQQCYLKHTLDSILLDLHMADTGGFHYGVKIVRGAYMEQERLVATEQGCESPVWGTKAETNTNYFRILEMMLNRVKNTPQDSIVVASHNEDTIHFAMDKIHELGLSKTDGRVVFGQVMGMADHLALAIGSAGYLAYKFMPYGSVEEVLPYLSRRANENRGMLMGPVRERKILAKEIKRRLTNE